MASHPLARYLEIDDFLPPDLHAALLAYALSNAARFEPTSVRPGTTAIVDTDIRQSLFLPAGLGPLEAAFAGAVEARMGELCAGAGVTLYPVVRSEAELAAHGDGHFYRIHHDTLIKGGRQSTKTDRVLTVVYYFHRQPRGFGQGELAIYPFGGGAAMNVEPRDNRLVAFASMTPHEVLPVTCPSGRFEDYRFAINCWLHRARQ